MGHAFRGLCPGQSSNVYPDLYFSAIVLPAVAAAVRACKLVLPHLWRSHLHSEQQGHRGRYGALRFACNVSLHNYNGAHSIPHGLGYDGARGERLGGEKAARVAIDIWGSLRFTAEVIVRRKSRILDTRFLQL